MKMQRSIPKREDVACFYDECAQEYCNSRTIHGGRLFNEYIEMPAVFNLMKGKMGGKRVLDIGCGVGIYTRYLASKGASVVGLDVSGKMIDLASKACRPFPEVSFENVSFEEYEHKRTAKFDIILGNFMLGYFLDLYEVFDKCSALLKQDGYCIFSSIHPVKLSSIERKDGYYVLDNYFDEDRFYRSDFMDNGREILLKKWTISDISDAVSHAKRLYIDRIVEPTPQNPPLDIDFRLIDFYNRCPSVLIVKLKKR